ncbi:MAG: polysaccharide deacetylase family protein [Pseudomonadota bacterium]
MRNTPLASILYHHIGAETISERGLGVTTPWAAFQAHLDALEQRFTFVSLEQVISGDLPRNALLLTFDDAYRSVLEAARQLLAPRGIPAVFFVNPGLLGSDGPGIDAQLAFAVNSAGIEAVCKAIEQQPARDVHDLIMNRMNGLSADAREGVRQRLRAQFGTPDVTRQAGQLNEEDLAEFAGLGVEIGNHTLRHAVCGALKPNELHAEIIVSQAKLAALTGTRIRSFAVPYGAEACVTPEVLHCLRDTGHEAIFLVHARSNRLRPAPDIWYRQSIENGSVEDIPGPSAVLPVLRSVKARMLGGRAAAARPR